MNNNRATIFFSAGILLCGTVRSFLISCQFRGFEIEFIESTGWFERDFTVKGRISDIEIINQQVHNWAKDNNQEDN